MSARLLLAALLLVGCGDNGTLDPAGDLPLLPPTVFTGGGFVWGHVVMDSGVCIPGAVVEIVAGPGAGRKMVQQTPCDAWSYGDGFAFDGLPLGAKIRLEASARGYQSEAIDVVTQNGGYPVTFELKPE
jgi:hypothetical protein